MKNQILQEVDGIKLGDARLDKRIKNILERISEKPGESFPSIFSDKAELEAFYRFVENPYIDSEDIFAAHQKASIERCRQAKKVLILHDTTEFSFSGKRMGSLGDRGSFFGHCSLALEAGSNTPLGVLRMQTWVRKKGYKSPTSLLKAGLISKEEARKLPSEKDRWFAGVKETSKQFSSFSNLIHVADSEGDDYNFFANLLEGNHRFVIRGYENRKLANSMEKLHCALERADYVCGRTVSLGNRKSQRGGEKRNTARDSRVAQLSIYSTSVNISRPAAALSHLPKELPLNIVYVKEQSPPLNTEPVEWILLTNESISSEEEVLLTVDTYRARWNIEEYFKALKTGCAFEKRQLESYSSLLICLMLLIPTAWLIFRLRSVARASSEELDSEILPKEFIETLEAVSNKKILSSQEALAEIAKLGGHIQYNGPPGWLVIWRGFRELASMARGYLLAKSQVIDLSIKRCDQS